LRVTLGIDNESAHWLLRRHGNRVSGGFELVKQEGQLAERITPVLPFIIADLVFCAQHEMVVHMEDLLRRRLPLLILSKMTPDELQRLVGIAAKALAWDDDRMKEECEPNQAGNAFARFYQLYL
jgi:glycerol-3-phosphate dehydrogenase